MKGVESLHCLDINHASELLELVKSVLNEPVERFHVVIEFNYDVDVLFKFDIELLLLSIEFNNDVDVEFKFVIDKDQH